MLLLIKSISRGCKRLRSLFTSRDSSECDSARMSSSSQCHSCLSDDMLSTPGVLEGSHVQEVKGSFYSYLQVAWAHPKYGNVLASCSYDRSVIIWKEQDGAWVKAFTSPPGWCESSVNSIAWAPFELGLLLACASSDGSVRQVYTADSSTKHKRRG